jgi:F-type H+-transporting ATPase subunit a
MKEIEHVALIHIPGIPDVVVQSWIGSLIIILIALYLRLILRNVPSIFQNLVEFGYERLNYLVFMLTHKEQPLILYSFLGTLFFFILTSNLLGFLPGMKSPTADLNIPATLALVVFCVVQFLGIKELGVIGYLKNICGGRWWMILLFMPIVELIGKIAQPLSLTIRLFANMFSKEILIGVLAMLFPLILPLPIMALGAIIVAPLQACIFTVLSTVYIALAIHLLE